MKHIYEIAKIKMQDVKGVGEEQVRFTSILSVKLVPQIGQS